MDGADLFNLQAKTILIQFYSVTLEIKNNKQSKKSCQKNGEKIT